MDINEATVHDLLEEICKRCTAVVCAYAVPDDDEQTNTQSVLSGHRATLLGLSHMLVAQSEALLGIREPFYEDAHDDDPEGDS